VTAPEQLPLTPTHSPEYRGEGAKTFLSRDSQKYISNFKPRISLQTSKGSHMSAPERNPLPIVKPFGNNEDPRLLWVARYVEQALEQLAIDPKERTLFLTLFGAPINPDSLTEYGRRYIKSANIEKPGACIIYPT
jgi:hypothetical protein